MLLGEHFFEVGVNDFGVEMEFSCVVAGERFLTFHDSRRGRRFRFWGGR